MTTATVDADAPLDSSPLEQPMSDGQASVLLGSVLVVALCGITYELIIATVSSYLLGNSVYQFSITIGLFMFAMGIGSYLTRFFVKDLLTSFVIVEILVALIGGLSSTILFTVFPWYAYYRPVMYALILIIGTLVGLEIPLLTRILSRNSPLRESIAKVLSLDYIGALIGSVAFPIVLLPRVGLFRSSFIIGLLNAIVALGTVYVFRDRLSRKLLCRILSALVLIVLLGCMIGAAKFASFAEGQLYDSQIVFRKQTPYQRLVVTKSDRSGLLRLYIDGHLQFAERDEYRYHEGLVHPVMSLPGSRARVLILGGGDGMAVREILKHDGVEQIDLVDIDPEMTQLGRKFEPFVRMNQNSMADERVKLHHVDAFSFIRETRDRFDRVIIDLPDPHDAVLSKLYSKEFYGMLKRKLNPGAFVVTQSSSAFATRETFWCIAKTFQAADFQTLSYQVAVPTFGSHWGFTLAAESGDVPQDFLIDNEKTNYMTTEVFQSGLIFGKDLLLANNEELPVNTITNPRLYLLYLKGLSRH